MPKEYKILGHHVQYLPSMEYRTVVNNISGVISVAIETGIGGWKAYQAIHLNLEDRFIFPDDMILQAVAALGTKMSPEMAALIFPKLDLKLYDQ